MKRATLTIMSIAAVHFAIMYLATLITVSHSLSGAFFFGPPPADTWATKLALQTSKTLRQPMEFLVSLLPGGVETEPEEIQPLEEALDLLLLGINSVLWAGVFYLGWKRLRQRFCKIRAA